MELFLTFFDDFIFFNIFPLIFLYWLIVITYTRRYQPHIWESDHKSLLITAAVTCGMSFVFNLYPYYSIGGYLPLWLILLIVLNPIRALWNFEPIDVFVLRSGDIFTYGFSIHFIDLFCVLVILGSLYFLNRLYNEYSEKLKLPASLSVGSFELIGYVIFTLIMLCWQDNLFFFFLWVECFGICFLSFILASNTQANGAEMGIKLLAINIVGTSFWLLGLVLFYGAIGTLSMQETLASYSNGVDGELFASIQLAGVFLLIGLVFKLSLSPFHFLVPDLFESTTPQGVVIYAGIFKLILILFFYKSIFFFSTIMGDSWQQFFLMLGFVTMLTGASGSVVNRRNMRRMVGYLVVGGAGILAILISNVAYNVVTSLLLYVAMDLLGIISIVCLWSRMDELITKHNQKYNFSKFASVSDYTYFIDGNYLFKAVMIIILFVLSGIPLFIFGFSKILALDAFASTNLTGTLVPFLLLFYNGIAVLNYLTIWEDFFRESGDRSRFIIRVAFVIRTFFGEPDDLDRRLLIMSIFSVIVNAPWVFELISPLFV